MNNVDLFTPLISCNSTICTGSVNPSIVSYNTAETPNASTPQGSYTGLIPIGGGNVTRFSHAIDIDPNYNDVVGRNPPLPAWSDRLVQPAALALNGSVGSGSLSAGTYCTVVTGIDSQPTPGESLPSNEVCNTVGASASIPLQFYDGQGYGFSGYRLYYGSTPGGEANYVTFGANVSSVVDYTFTSTSGATSGTPPTIGTAYLSALFRSSYGSTGDPESILLGAAPGGNLLYPLHIGACTIASHAAKMCVMGPLQVGALLASGIVDGQAPITITTGATATLGGTYNGGYTYNQEATAATAVTYTLPAAAAGSQYCVGNSNNGSAADTGALTLQTSAAGQYIDVNGTLTASHGYVISSGAAGDKACVIGISSTVWEFYPQAGTWVGH